MSDPKVFIAQLPMKKNPDGVWVSKNLDLSKSEDFGELTVVWPPDASLSPRGAIERQATVMGRHYNDETDYMIALGSPSLICALAWAIGRAGKRLRMLEWQNREQRYVPTMLNTIFDREED